MSDCWSVASHYIGLGLISEQSSGIFGGGTGVGASVSVLQFSLVSYHFTSASLDQGSQTRGPPVYFMQALH